jgi:bacillithiol system protein YtxJ
MLKKIDTMEQFEEVLKREEKFMLMKHSLTCPISHAAYQEYQKFAEKNQDFPTYFLAVQEVRMLSNNIAEKFQVKHESPQALLFSNGEHVWNTSHWKITVRSLDSAISE